MRAPPQLVRVVARGKQRVPPQMWPVLQTLASVPGTGPLVADPDPVKTLLVCAHPDDELGCAGTVALLCASGAETRVVYATDGDATRGSPYRREETGARRRQEAVAACSALGVREQPDFWGLPDGQLAEHVEDLADRIAAAVDGLVAKRVLVPWFLDGHRDHQAVSRAVARAALPDEVEVWGFEWWTPLPANRIVDITDAWPAKQAAAAAHATAALAFDITAALGLSRWRSLGGLQGRGFAEAFLALPVDQYRDVSGQRRDRQ